MEKTESYQNWLESRMSLYKPIAVEKIGYNLTGKKGAWQWFDVGGESGYGNWTCNFRGQHFAGEG